jgi:tellurite resistance protein TerC
MLRISEPAVDIKNNLILKFVKRFFRVTAQLHGQQFIVRLPHPHSKRLVWWLTPLMIALILIEIIDIAFAIDSVPAIFAITQDPFIVYTSNVFAILGLRALYFALAAIIHNFQYLKPALALILIFIGGKVFAADLLGLEKFPASISLGVTLVLLSGGVLVSVFKRG